MIAQSRNQYGIIPREQFGAGKNDQYKSEGEHRSR